MQKHTSLLVLAYTLGVLASLEFGHGSIVGDHSAHDRSCVESEKQALLQFKRGLIDEYNYLSSWAGDDCCAWEGVACNNKSAGHVTKLDLRGFSLVGVQIFSSSLLNLKYLSYLDLSSNKFDEVQIPNFLGSFNDLTYLNLSDSNFKGLVPQHLGNLSSLRYLDLGNSDYFTDSYSLLSIDSMGWLSKLSLLKYLDLSNVNLSRATDWFPAINMLPSSMLVLKLHNCGLPNNIPRYFSFMNLTSLVSLDLGNNLLKSSFPLWVCNNSGLTHLILRSNHFFGPIPQSLGSLTSLSKLDLSANKFQGLIPEVQWDLTSLTYLDLSVNNLHGLISQSIGNLTSLSTLVLSRNKLSNLVPSEMGNLTKLTYLDIASNEFSGCLPVVFCQLSKLEILFVGDNQLSGSLPKCIGQLSNLEELNLSSNSWEGFVTEQHFVNLTGLESLSISSKSNLVLNVSSKWIPPFGLDFLHMESIKVGPKFPRWLQGISIRMPNTSISDTIPANMFVALFSYTLAVDLSNNDIKVEPFSLVSAAPYLTTLALSNIRMSGEFPSFLCNLTSLRFLSLSNNNFSGELPKCLGNLRELRDLDLMNNRFSGDIPISLGALGNLSYLNLHNNKFQGKLPLSFRNLSKLVTLDGGKNNLSDSLPPWTGKQLPSLKYLILRSNNFYGKIPTQLCHHSAIQVLNLASNQITGNIPPCFGNFTAMIASDNSDHDHSYSVRYGEMIIDDAKGYELNYTSTLGFLFSIDLSNNNISGEIPKELMDLCGLLNLNLAGNHLSRRIPDSIGKLGKLEFLDLSRNELYGPVPKSLSELNFLSRLNLSFNHLSGRLPTGNQLQTLDDPSIYAGNNQLCGEPLLKPCTGDKKSYNHPNYNESDSDWDDECLWFYAGIGPGLLVGFLGFCASLHFIKSWRYSYFYFVERVIDKITVVIASLQNKIQN